MEYLFEYLVFLAEVITLTVALVVIISALASMSMRNAQHQGSGHLVIEKMNDRIRDLRHAMESGLLPANEVKKQHKKEAKEEAKKAKQEAKQEKQSGKQVSAQASSESDQADTDSEDPASEQRPDSADDSSRRRVFFIRFEGDVKASAVDKLRTEVNAILTLATPEDEVVVAVESPGGMVHSYGLAASQLTRFRAKDIPLTVVVDKVAASGGYLMAAVANKILAAPFALVGSIGVVAQVPNVHRLLKKNDVDVDVLTAGKHKRTLTMLGENTEEGRQKFQEELEDVHALFQEFVGGYRPALDMDTVATGEAWYGKRALDLKLVDEIQTSDEYLLDACEKRDVFSISWDEQKKPIDRLFGRVNGLIERIEDWVPARTTQ